MTYKQILLHISNIETPLLGTVRPALNRQLDMWEIKGHKYMVTTSKLWNPIKRPGLTTKAYNEKDIVRIELLTEIKP